jgi:hypothetical protein
MPLIFCNFIFSFIHAIIQYHIHTISTAIVLRYLHRCIALFHGFHGCQGMIRTRDHLTAARHMSNAARTPNVFPTARGGGGSLHFYLCSRCFVLFLLKFNNEIFHIVLIRNKNQDEKSE